MTDTTDRSTTADERQIRAELPANPEEWKIFPRNLTARASAIVLGNPTTTRPEDGVDNCFPGLEMDARNIEKYFFPGLYFEVYRDQGAQLAGLVDPAAKQLPLDENDVKQELQVWAMKGRVTAEQSSTNPPIITFIGKDLADAKAGLYVWRKAGDLFRGRVGLILGPGLTAADDSLKNATTLLEAKFADPDFPGHVERADGRIQWAVLVAERTEYLNDEGTLDPDIYEPGELTRTLCTPWTYDFRDCQCFYWASNKPDIVSSEDGQYEYLNFQRKSRDLEPQTEDIAYSYKGRRAQEIDYAEMMVDWQQLRPVLNGREHGQTYKPLAGPDGDLMDLPHIIEEVRYLASVEHGLAVQYLYSYYSIDAPQVTSATDGESPVPKVRSDAPTDDRELRLWSAAREIFSIAIDEMRHFLWANEILSELGADTTSDRATMLGRRLQVPFNLQSLSSAQLQFFIDVERPSKSTNVGLDGMYVGVLRSLQALDPNLLADVSAENIERSVEITKLIIDEGELHYQRFSTAQQNLAYYDDAGRSGLPGYIRQGQWGVSSEDSTIPMSPMYGAPVKSPYATVHDLQEKSDRSYAALLGLLKIAFAFKPAEHGKVLPTAVSQMFRLNAINLSLAGLGGTPLFTLPLDFAMDPPPRDRASAMKILDKVRLLLSDASDAVMTTATATAATGTDAAPHDTSVDDMLTVFQDQIDRVYR